MYKVSKSTPNWDEVKKKSKELAPFYAELQEQRLAILVKFQEKHHIHHSSLVDLFNKIGDNVTESQFKNYDQYVDYLACFEAWDSLPDRFWKEKGINLYS